MLSGAKNGLDQADSYSYLSRAEVMYARELPIINISAVMPDGAKMFTVAFAISTSIRYAEVSE